MQPRIARTTTRPRTTAHITIEGDRDQIRHAIAQIQRANASVTVHTATAEILPGAPFAQADGFSGEFPTHIS